MVSFLLKRSWQHQLALRYSSGRERADYSVVAGQPCKSVRSFSCLGMTPSGSLCSAGITPLHRYYGPIRLPANPHETVMSSCPALGFAPHSRGISVPDSFFQHAPSFTTPGNPATAFALLLHRRHWASSSLTAWPFPTGVTRLHRFTCVMAHTFADRDA
jgi:hypothetical protein